jgi:hypothetical protein
MNVLVTHIPHAIPVVVIWGILLRFWLAQRRLNRAEDATLAASAGAGGSTPATPATPVGAPSTGLVRRSVAVRGMLALGPLIGALGTGLVIYASNLGSSHAGAAAIWAHVGISMLAMLLVGYKLAEVGMRRLREAVTVERVARTGASIILLALWVPLLATGIALLIFPSTSSLTAYAHLIASVWWTGLLLWHLRRYLVRATAVVLFDRPPPARAAPPVPSPAREAPRAGETTAPRRPARPTARVERRRTGGPARTRAARNSPLGEGEAAGVSGEDGAPAPSHGR